jgi:predicted ATPase
MPAIAERSAVRPPAPSTAVTIPAQMPTARAATIRTPDQRVRVFASSTLRELAAERRAVREAVTRLHLVPVMFELGARPHPPRQVYRDYLAQSQIFVGVYWQSYGWVPPGADISGLEDELRLSAGMPKLIYVKSPAPHREPRLEAMLASIEDDGGVSYKEFSDADELQLLVENDLAVLLSERFEQPGIRGATTARTALASALPAPATSLIDRQADGASVQHLVLQDRARLITLTGPGGVGKSRLALEAASRLQPHFRDGVRFVDLGSVRAGSMVAAAVAAGFGLSTSASQLMPDLKAYLGPRQLLVVLDNFEQVSDAAPVIAELLAAAPELVVLTTSRAVLRLRGEHEFPVAPLVIPPHGAERDMASLLRCASVQLFVQRARAADPEFMLADDNCHAVAEICRRLDGLPLAIELAAARIRTLPPAALLDRLDADMSVLSGGPRDLPERQRTLRNTLDWSYGLLEPSEQILFARLGVFAGTFGLPAVMAICGDTQNGSDTRIIDTLIVLVDSSLVQPLADGDKPRFGMLETVRQYALERLHARGDWQEVHDRHADYFVRITKPGAAEVYGGRQLTWLNRLEIRHDNLSSAASWLIDSGQPGPAVALLWATWRFWWLHGHLDELSELMERLLASPDGLSRHQRARVLAGTGFTLFVGGDQSRAQSLLKRSLPLFRESGDYLGCALVSAAVGHILATQGEGARARQILERTLLLLNGADERQQTAQRRALSLFNLALVSNFLGQIGLTDGEYQRAARLFEDGLAAARSARDRFIILISTYDLARAKQAAGDLSGAAALLGDGLTLATEAGDNSSAAYYLEALGDVAAQQDCHERAVVLLSAASALLEAGGSGWLHAYVPRAPHDANAIAGPRSRIGDAAFRQAQARGRSIAATGVAGVLTSAL